MAKALRIFLITLSVVLICFLGWFAYRFYMGYKAVETGAEYDPIKQGEWLRDHFSDHLGVAGYKPGWTKHAWANGFREHTWLIYAQPSHDFATRLFQHIRINPSKGRKIGGRELLDSVEFYPKSQIPEWWDYADKGEIECVKLHVDGWFYIFGYAKGNSILYMLIRND